MHLAAPNTDFVIPHCATQVLRDHQPAVLELSEFKRFGKLPHNFLSSAGSWSDKAQAEGATITANMLVRHFKRHLLGIEVRGPAELCTQRNHALNPGCLSLVALLHSALLRCMASSPLARNLCMALTAAQHLLRPAHWDCAEVLLLLAAGVRLQ